MVSDSVTNDILVAVAVVSAVAAIFSARSARKGVAYSRSARKADVSLHTVEVGISRSAAGQINIRPIAYFENVGKEPLRVLEIKTGYYEFKAKQFTSLTDDHGLASPIHRGVAFNHPWSFDLAGVPAGLTEQVAASLGKLALLVTVEYEGVISGRCAAKYYLGYKFGKNAYHLTIKDYLEMEPHLPNAFKRDA
ncbi:MAG: hypothetical protein V3T12_07120 [Acidiferrobacterales bacterium]